MAQDPAVIADMLRRAGENSKKHVAYARTVFDQDIEAYSRDTIFLADLIVTLKTALTCERIHADQLRKLLDDERCTNDIYIRIAAQNDNIIGLLVQTCKDHGVELPPRLTEGPPPPN